jgi:hypothetical protein
MRAFSKMPRDFCRLAKSGVMAIYQTVIFEKRCSRPIENKKLFREAVMPNRYWLVLSQLSFYPLSGGLYMLPLNTASSQKWPSET